MIGILRVFLLLVFVCPSAWAQTLTAEDKDALEKGKKAENIAHYSEAADYYRKAAEHGNAMAEFELGWLYQMGYGVPKNIDTAMAWYKKSADQGYANAENNLGYNYEEGIGVPKERAYQEAMVWYRKAAEHGFAQAMLNIGGLYNTGKGVPKDYTIAMQWFMKAAAAPDKRSRPVILAQNSIGYYYLYGQGVAQNTQEATTWYRKSADQGDAVAQSMLGVIYVYFDPKNYAEGLRWTTLSAQQGSAVAQNNIGYIYENGFGVPVDYAQAWEWYKKSAAKNYPRAFYHMAVLCDQQASGIVCDRAQVEPWMRHAADGDVAEAKQWLAVRATGGGESLVPSVFTKIGLDFLL